MFNKKKTTKLGRSPFLIWQIIGVGVLALTLASLVWCLVFIYQYLYNTLDEANSIVVLKSSPDLDEIETELYNKTQTVLIYKQPTSTIMLSKRNIFGVVDAPVNTATATVPTPNTHVSSTSSKGP